jgi:hypothetical protein
MRAGCCSRRPMQREEPASASGTASHPGGFALTDSRNLRAEEVALRQELAQVDQSPRALEQLQDELQLGLLRSLEENAKRASDAAARHSAEADALFETHWRAAVAASVTQADVAVQLHGSGGAAADKQQSWVSETHPDEPEPEPASDRAVAEGEPPF